MDILAAITGSRVRADVLAVLFGAPPRAWNLSDLGRAARQPHQLVERELKRLAAAGFVRVRTSDRKRRYDAEADAPAARELARFVRQTRGRIPRLRHALVTLRSPTLGWVCSVPATDRGSSPPERRRLDLVVLTGAPKALVRVQLAGVVDRDTEVHCMSVREWIARLQKGEVFVRRARRARKLWVLGTWEGLVLRERAELDARRILRSASANWRDDLSDEWDEDPFEVPTAPIR